MKAKFLIQSKRERILNIICVVLLLIIALWTLDKNTSIRIVGDEFGYWSFGAYLNRYDWTSIASGNKYYNWGYGIILALLMRMHLDMQTTYQIAILLNALFVVGIFFISQLMLVKLASSVEWKTRMLVAFAVAVYPSNLIYAQFTLVECILIFSYWVLMFLAIKLLDDYKWSNIIAFCIAACWCYCLHMRMLGTIIAAVLYIFVCFKGTGSGKKKVVAFVCVALLFWGIGHIKQNYQDVFLSAELLGFKKTTDNDYGTQFNIIRYVLTLQGIKELVLTFLGKMFYMGAATLMFGWFGIARCILAIKRLVTKQKGNIEYFYVFALLNFLFCLAIACMNSLSIAERLDIFVYGRYYEQTVGPLVLIGIIYVLERKNRLAIIFMCFLFVVCSIACNAVMPYGATDSHVFMNCAGISDVYFWLKQKGNINEWLPVLQKMVLVIFSFVLVVLYANSKIVKVATYVLVLTISCRWIAGYFVGYNEGTLSWSCKQKEKEIELLVALEEDEWENAYYIGASGDGGIMFLQFLLAEKSIQIVESVNDIKEESRVLVFTDKKREMPADYSKAGESSYLAAWIK